jgi:hypothetical protein
MCVCYKLKEGAREPPVPQSILNLPTTLIGCLVRLFSFLLRGLSSAEVMTYLHSEELEARARARLRKGQSPWGNWR